jgi:predicted Zn-dependent peptidase
MSGNSQKSAASIAEEIDELGGFVFKSSDFYSAGISIYGLDEHIGETIRLVNEAIQSVEYLDEEIAVYKRNRLSELNINLQKTSYLASKGINSLLCGKDHDISFQLTEEIIQNTSKSELTEFKKTHLNDPYFIFTGSEKTDIEGVLKQNNFAIKPYQFEKSDDQKLQTLSEKQLLIRKEGSTQNSIRFGAVWPKRGHEDFFRLSLLNLILGGYFGSRLMKNIREDKGLTYGIHSSITPYNDFSLFKISCEYNSNFTDNLINEIVNEIERLKNETIEPDELTSAKNYLLGVMLRNFDGAFPISDKFKQYLDSNLGKGYYQKYFEAINSITAEDLKMTANNYFKENTLTYCISGV